MEKKGYSIVEVDNSPLVAGAHKMGSNELIDRIKTEEPTKDQLSLALCSAVSYENYDNAKTLIEYGADPNYSNGSPLSIVAESPATYHTSKLVDLLIDNGAVDTNQALITAVKNGNEEVTSILIDKNIDISFNNYHSFQSAARDGEIGIVKSMIDNYEIPKEVVKEAFALACENGELGSKNTLLPLLDKNDHEFQNNVIERVAFFKDLPMIKELVEKDNFSINKADNRATHTAVSSGDKEIMKYLVTNADAPKNHIKDSLLVQRLLFTDPTLVMVVKQKGNDFDKNPTPKINNQEPKQNNQNNNNTYGR